MVAGFTTIAIKDATGTTKQLAVYADVGGTLYPAPTGTDALGDIVGLAATPAVVSSSPKITASSTMTRPNDTTAYTSLDLIGNSTTANQVVAITLDCARGNDIAGVLSQLWIETSGTELTNCVIRGHIFNVDPYASPPTGGDNAAWALASKAGYLGYWDFTCTAFAFTNGKRFPGLCGVGSETKFTPATGTQRLYISLQAMGAFTPIALETFQIYGAVI